ncbi:MAG: MoaD/ThiS family protein [Thermotogota bacterium]
MNVEVRLHGSLIAAQPGLRAGEPFTVEIRDGTSIAFLAAALSLAPADIHLAIVNGRIVHDRDVPLTAGDRVGLFPPVGGG